MSNPNIKYRPDIDGLRAIAVLSVVAFHAFPSIFTGGFIGVDIFFVISGFLISTILFKSLENNTFSFSDFYSRRIKRIFPALIVVLLGTFALGWATLTASEYKLLGKHIIAGAGFVSNLALWGESGYFDTSAEFKPLLHLWSLGIEEQFYIVWPVALLAAWKLRLNVLTIVVLIATASFSLNIIGIQYNATATFYSPQTRFWELLSGSLLAWISTYKPQELKFTRDYANKWLSKLIFNSGAALEKNVMSDAVALVGISLLAYGFFAIDKDSFFPGYLAAIPVVGAVMIIFAGPDAWINRVLLASRPMVWIGLISFPLYLWHWPLVSILRISESEPDAWMVIASQVLAVVLAWATYRVIEIPLRRHSIARYKVPALACFMVLVACLGVYTYKSDGIPDRIANTKFLEYSESIVRVDKAREDECFEIPYAYKKPGNWFCTLGRKGDPVTFFAYGDSHALSLLPALDRFANSNPLSINFTATSGCPPLLGIQSMRGGAAIEKYNCKALNDRIFNYVKLTGIKHVILIGRWPYYTGSSTRPEEFNPITRNPSIKPTKESSARDFAWAVENTVSRYASIGVTVTFIEDNPQQQFEPKQVLRKGNAQDEKYNAFSVSMEVHIKNQALASQAIRKHASSYVNFDNYLCANGVCPLVKGKRFLYFDDDHLSYTGAMTVYPALSAKLKQLTDEESITSK